MAADEKQKQAAKRLHEAFVWMAACPIESDRAAAALYETMGTWVDDTMGDAGLHDAYAEAGEADDAEDTSWEFWERVLALV